MWRTKLIIFLSVNLLVAQSSSSEKYAPSKESWITTKVVNLVSAEIERRTGLNTRVKSGTVEFINRTIVLNEIELGDGLVTIPKANIKLAVIDLIKGGIGIDSIEIENPVINLSEKTRSRINWKSQTASSSFLAVPKITIKSAIANVLDQSLVLGMGLYRFDAQLSQGKDGYINFRGDSRFVLRQSGVSVPISMNLIGELSSGNYLTTRIAFQTPKVTGQGDGQIHLGTGETKYSLYSDSNIFLKPPSLLSALGASNIKHTQTSIKINRMSKDSDWRFFIDTEVKLTSSKQPIKAQLLAHIPTNSYTKILKLDYTKITMDRGLIELTKMDQDEFTVSIMKYPIKLFKLPLSISDLNKININATGRMRIHNLLSLYDLHFSDFKGNFVRNNQDLGNFDLDFQDGKIRLRTLSFTSGELSVRSITSPMPPPNQIDFIFKYNLQSLKVGNSAALGGLTSLGGHFEAKGTLFQEDDLRLIDGDFTIKDLNVNLLRFDTLSGKISITPNHIQLTELESQGRNKLSGALSYPLGSGKEGITGHINFIDNDYREMMSLWTFNPIFNSTFSGRLDINGQRSSLNINAKLSLNNPRWGVYSLPPLSFEVRYDEGRKKLGILDFKTITSDTTSSSPITDAKGLKGEAFFNLKERTSSIKITGDLKSTIQARGNIISGLINVDLDGDLNRPFGYFSYPLGQIKIVPYPDSKNKLRFLYAFDGKDLSVTLDDIELEQRLVELKATGNESASKGIFSVKQLNDHYLSYFLTDTYLERLLGSSTFDIEGQFDSKLSEFNYSLNILNLTGILNKYGLDRKKEFTLSGNQDRISVNFSFTNFLEKEANETSFFTIKGFFPWGPSSQYDLEILGQTSIKDLSDILTRLRSSTGPFVQKEYELSGRSHYQIKVTGDADTPKLAGQIDLRDAAFTYQKVNLLQHFDGKINLTDLRIDIDAKNPIRGDFFGSSMKITGGADWNLRQVKNIQLSAQAKNIYIQSFPGWDGLKIKADASFGFISSASSNVLTGNLNVQELSYFDENQLFETISSSSKKRGDLVTKNDLFLDNLQLDINIDSNYSWRYDSEFIKAELKPRGPFKVLGTLLRPIFQGEIALTSTGRVANVFPAGDLILERGVIQIIDDLKDPQIDIQGSLTVPGYKLNLGLVGKLSDLKIQAAATPSLKRDEIFALLMDPDYATRLYSSTVSYTGTTGYQALSNQAYSSSGSSLFTSLILSDLQTRLRKSLGLDRVLINIRTGASGRLESSYQVGINLWNTPYPLVLSQNQIGDLRINSAKLQWSFPFGLANLGLSQTAGYSIYPSGELRFNWSSHK